MRSRKIRESVQVPHTRDGVTVMVEQTREHQVPTLPRDWDVIAVRAATGLVLALTAVSVAWSTWSIGAVLHGGIGYAAGAAFDVAWATCVLLEWMARHDPTKRAFPRRLGWVLLAGVMVAIGWHGMSVGDTGMAVVGAAVSGLAKVLWVGVLRHVDAQLSDADQAWVSAQVSEAHARLAVASVRRQVARMEDRATRELLAMEAARARYGTGAGRSAEATVEVLPGPGTTVGTTISAALTSSPDPGTTVGTNPADTQMAETPAEVPQDQDSQVPQVNPGSDGPAGTPHLRPVRGSATQEIRALIASGVTDAGTIQSRLSETGLGADPSYIRRLIRAARPADTPPPGQYL